MEINLTDKIQSSLGQTLLHSIVLWGAFLTLYTVNLKMRASKYVSVEISR